jgi:hypothetical protein
VRPQAAREEQRGDGEVLSACPAGDGSHVHGESSLGGRRRVNRLAHQAMQVV